MRRQFDRHSGLVSGILRGMERTDADTHHATLAAPRTERDAPPTVAAAGARSRSRVIAVALASRWALVPVVFVALFFRLYGLQWDGGCAGLEQDATTGAILLAERVCHLHPDERFVTDVTVSRILPEWPPADWGDLLRPDVSPLNPRTDPATGQPRDFSYGSLPLFVTKAVAGAMTALTNVPWSDYDRVVIVGRVLSAFFDVGTLLLAYLLGRRYAPWAGLLAAALYAVSVLPIQLAHFYATDAWGTFFAVATLWAAVRATERGGGGGFALAGLFAGLAVASKATFVFLALPLLAALVFDALRRRDAATASPWSRLITFGATVFVAAFAAFAVAEPYALVRMRTYLTAIGTQASMVKGDLDFPYTRQYVGTGPLFHVTNMVQWGMGPALGLFALAGGAWAVVRLFRSWRATDAVLLAWVVPYAGYTAFQSVKFMRYWEPLYAPLLVLGAAMIADAVRQPTADSRQPLAGEARSAPTADGYRLSARFLRPVALGVTALVLVCTSLWAVAFTLIYGETHPRVAASRWFEANATEGATVATEIWDDGFPQPVTATPKRFRPVEVRPGSGGLDLYPDEGPGEQRLQYLQRAMAGSDYLVFSSTTVRGSIPQLPWRYPVTIRWYELVYAEQLGFTKVHDEWVTPRLGPWRFDDQRTDQSFTYYDHPRVLIYRKTRVLSLDELRPLFAQALAVDASPTRGAPKSPMLDRPVDTLPPVGDRGWSGAITGSGAAAVLAYLLLFELFGLIGWPVAARVFRRFPDRGWGVAKLLGWLGVAYVVWIGASLRVTMFTAVACAVVLALAVIVAAVIAWRTRVALRQHLRAAWRTMLAAEVAYLAGIALFLVFRLRNPDLWQTYWGGEKTFELAHLNALMRSPFMPPYDPWFAGGAINYYYWGGYLHTVAMKLTGVPTEIAFNVALPLTMGLVWGAAFTVGAAFWKLVSRRPERETDAVAGGILAALGVGFFGNLNAAGQVIAFVRERVPLAEWPRRFDFWQGTRLIEINEFPFFSGLYADLHAHLIALPFALTVVGLSLAVATHWDRADRDLSARTVLHGAPWAAIGLAGAITGALYCINAWDFPTAIVLMAAGVLAGVRYASGRWSLALGAAAGIAALLVLVARVFYAPFFASFVSLYSSLERVRTPAPLAEFVVIFGIMLAVIGFGLAAARPVKGWVHTFVNDERGVILGTLVVGGTLIAWATGHRVLVVTLPLIGFLAMLWLRAEGRPARRVLFGVGAFAFALLGAVDVIFLADRMNTVFKFYFQAWNLLALTTVGFVALVAERWRHAAAPFRVGFTAVAVAGLVCALGYPVLGTPARLQYRMPPSPLSAGLNGNAWMETGSVLSNQTANSGSGTPLSFADDLALINWMNGNVAGTPVVAEAAIGPYRGHGSRISSATGFPTVVGWNVHESQQREADIGGREADVRTLYTSREAGQVIDVIERYRVRYIVVGEVERLSLANISQGRPYSTPEGLATLAQMAERGMLRVAWQHNRTTLYEVATQPGEARR